MLDVSAPAILQLFESTYGNAEDRAADVFLAGYGGVWIPPTGRADSGNQSVGYDVFDRFDLGSPGNATLYGTETGLKSAVEELHQAGQQVYVDFVLNHNGFRDSSTFGFVDAGGYPGFAVTLNAGNNGQNIDDIDGDFHGAFESGDLNGRLAGLIDIDQGKNHQLIRHPVDPGNANNVPGGSVFNVADAGNARFYPDTDLTPIMVFDPSTGESNIPIFPFNTGDPTAGDAAQENALGLLMRNAQWLVQTVGVDGFRLDAVKHFDTFVLEFFDRAVYRSIQETNLDGSQRNVFSFSEVFDGDKAFQQTKIRKDIDPGDPGRVGGNRDVLDFPLFFALNDNLTSNGFTNDWRNVKNASQDVQDDGFANNGSQGVAFVNNHDENGPFLDNVAHAFVLMRPGNAAVYFNAEEFGQGRDFPKDGRGDALGGQFGDAITTLVNIRNSHGRGDYIDRTPGADEKEMLIFERSASSLTVLSNRTDGGFDSRTIQTNFLAGTPLIELTGNAADGTIDPFNDFPEVLTVAGDGTVNLRVPRNTSPSGMQHNSGYLVYGAAGPQGTLSLTNVASTIAAETPTPQTNGTTRVTPIDVITADTFNVQLDTVAVNHLGSIRDQFADGDNALLKIDGGIDLNSNAGVDFVSADSTGFEEFTTLKQPGFFEMDGVGQYIQTVDATALSEGTHFLDVRAFRHREPGEGDAIFSSFRKVIYVDRLAPVSAVDSFDPNVAGVNENRQLRIRSTDQTANSVHVFLDVPAATDNATILGMVGAGSQTSQIDRDLFSRDFTGLTHSNHVATVVSFEQTGNVNVQRVPGLFTSTIFGAGLGDLDTNGDVDATDILQFETVLQSGNTQFNPAADFDADGDHDLDDLSLFHQRLLEIGANAATLAAFDTLVANNATLDFGDAPDPLAATAGDYPTLQTNDGARHTLNVGPFLGAGVDAEADGQPDATSTGDDADGNDDEAGVTIPGQLNPGLTSVLSVTASGAGLLNAFLDLNGDGDWDDAGEHFARDVPLVAGSNSVSMPVSAMATSGETVARFRFDTFGGLDATGLASNGEVEDYAVSISAATVIIDDTAGTATVDGTVNGGEFVGVTNGVGSSFGDVIGTNATLSVDSSNTGTVSFGLVPTTAIGGGSGTDVTVIYLDNGSGTGVTGTASISDFTGNSERAISGDGSAAGGDESDLTFAPGLTASHAISVEGGFIGLWSIANDGSLNLLAGRTNDGGFDLGTHSFSSATSGNTREWSFDLAALGLSPGDSFGYFATHLNSSNGFRSNEFQGVDASTIAGPLPADPHIGQNAFSLQAGDLITFLTVPPPLDYGDAPTAVQSGFVGSYPVTIPEDGARHTATGPRLGVLRDAEDNGQPTGAADGDDMAGSADEDGVAFSVGTLLVSPAQSYNGMVTIDLQNPDGASNRLDAWIDFNLDGDWSDSGEQIFTNRDLGTMAGQQTLSFTIPTGTPEGQTFSRFRVSTSGSLAVTGAAGDGEVEDHALTFIDPDPTVSISGPAGSTNADPFDVTVVFSEAVSGFVSGEVTVSNGTVNNFVDDGGGSFTVTIDPTADGLVTVDVAAAVATDAAGNANTLAPQFSVMLDTVPTTPVLGTSESSPTNASPIPMTATFGEPVVGFDVSDLSVSGGTVTSFSGSGASYSFDVTPSADGTITVDVPAGAAQDLAGNATLIATQLSIVSDRTAPAASISGPASPTNSDPFNVTVSFGEAVSGFDSSNVTVGNGSVTNVVDDGGGSFTVTIDPTSDGQVTVDVSAMAAQDAAGNDSTAAGQFSLTFDSTPPTPVIASTETSPTNASPIAVTVMFGESVTGFDAGDLSVSGGSVSNFSGSGSSYSFNLTPGSDGTATVDIAAAAAQDTAGNSSQMATQFSIVSDRTPPPASISGPASPTNSDPFDVTVSFGEAVSGFVSGDVAVGNGSVTNVVDDGGGSFTVTIDPTADGLVTVDVAGMVAQDTASNDNTAAGQFSVAVDTASPTPVIASTETSPTNASPIPVTVMFGESVTGFDAGDLTVSGGSVGNFSGSGASHSFDVTPGGDGTVTVDISAGAAQDTAGNSSLIATQFSIVSDRTAPAASISGPASPTNSDPFDVTVAFGETVSGFASGDVTIGNGSVTNVVDDGGGSFTVTIDPTADGLVTVDVAGMVAQDAAGNDNTAAGQFSVTVDTTSPTPVIASTESSPTNASPIPVTVMFGESVTGFDAGDLTVSGGSVGNFSGSGASYSFDLTPAGDGTVTANIAAGVSQDTAGNSSLIATQFSIVSDRTAPAASISGPASPTANVPFDVTISFGEPVSGFTSTDVTVGNGSVTNVVDDGGGSFTVTINPTDVGQTTVDVAAMVAQDAAGNDNTVAGQYSVTVVNAILGLSIAPSSISENGGSATATVTRNVGTDSALTVSISADLASDVSTPATIDIPIGQSQTTFAISGADDALLEVTETVTVTVTATGFIPDSDTFDVTDDEVNVPPTLDVVSDQVVNPGAGIQIPLAGITSGGEATQVLRVSAVSSDGAKVAVTSVSYSSPAATGTVELEAFSPGLTNFADITVRVEDGGADRTLATTGDNAESTRTFRVGVTGDVTIDVPSINPAGRQFEVRRSGGLVDVIVESVTSAQFSADALGLLTIDGTAGNDRLLVDFSGGDPVPGGGLLFNGGSQVGLPGDSLALTGGAATLVTHQFTDRSSGSVDVDSSIIMYSGLEPILDQLVASDRVFVFGGTNDDVQIGDDASSGNGLSRINSATSSETVDFTAPTGSIRIMAGAGNDRVRVFDLDSGPVGVIVEGEAGVDTVEGGSAADSLDGGAGDDLVIGNRGDDVLTGGDDNDVLRGGAGADQLDGGNGDDVLLGNGGAGDQLTGGLGNDILSGGAGGDIVIEQADVDFTATDISLTGVGMDTLVNVELLTLLGGPGANRIDAGLATIDVVLLGLAGNDSLTGGAGNDDLRGSAGRDLLIGGPGNDRLFGQGGSGDLVSGGLGDDFLDGGAGFDLLREQADVDFTATDASLNGLGNDTLVSIERLILIGGVSANRIDASAATLPVVLIGFEGNDSLTGGSGDDALRGSAGRDQLRGGAGNDGLFGQGTAGDDLDGEAGADVLDGGGGGDVIRSDAMDTVISDVLDILIGP